MDNKSPCKPGEGLQGPMCSFRTGVSGYPSLQATMRQLCQLRQILREGCLRLREGSVIAVVLLS